MVPFEAGCEGEAGEEVELPLRACIPPTTPPTIAAAMRRTSIAPNSNQKGFRLRPRILRSGGIGGGAPTCSLMVGGGMNGFGEMGLGPNDDDPPGPSVDPPAESGDAGAQSDVPRWACDCFSLR